MRLRPLKYILHDVFESIGWFFIKFVMPERIKCESHGRCRFYGDQKFIELANESIEYIRKLDYRLYEKLRNAKITYIQAIEGHSPWKKINRRYVISDSLLSDVNAFTYGVVTYFLSDQAFTESGRLKYRFFLYDNQDTLGLLDARDWLQKNEFNRNYIKEIDSIIRESIDPSTTSAPSESAPAKTPEKKDE